MVLFPMPMPVPTAWQFCPEQSCVHFLPKLVPCSPQLALRVQMHELCVCPMLVLTARLHPQGPVLYPHKRHHNSSGRNAIVLQRYSVSLPAHREHATT